MGWYIHAVPADGGLFVPAKNLAALIKDINALSEENNEIYEDDPAENLHLNPRNPVEAMETLRRHHFYIHQKEPTHGVTLTGWGTNGDPHTGYPAEALKIQEIFPREIIEAFHSHATQGGVMVMSDYNDDTLYLAGYPTELVCYSDSMIINDTVEVKEFVQENGAGAGASVMTMQEIPASGSPDDNTPAVVCKNGSMREIRAFYAACARKATQGMGDPRFSVAYDMSNSFTMQETKKIIQRDSSALQKNR